MGLYSSVQKRKIPDLIILYLVKQLIYFRPSDIKNIKPNERVEVTQWGR